MSGNEKAVFLDYYFPKTKKRKKEYLNLKIYKTPKTVFEKDHNKKTLQLAESIRAKKLLELQHVENGFEHLVKKNVQFNFIEYFQKLTDDRFSSQGNYGNWDSVLKHLIAFTGDYVNIYDINPEWVARFKFYLKEKARTKSNNKLSQNTLHSYFNKFKAAMNSSSRK